MKSLNLFIFKWMANNIMANYASKTSKAVAQKGYGLSVIPYLLLIFLITALTPIWLRGQGAFPLKVSVDHRYLVDDQGEPFPILGRTAWFILSQHENGYKMFLHNTLEHGHNAIEFAAIMHWPMGNHAPFSGNGEIPFLKRLDGKDWDGSLHYDTLLHGMDMPDLLTPNERYWTFVDNFLNYCESINVMAFMFPAYLGYNGDEQGWMKELVANGDTNVEAFGRWVATRYKDRKNIVWMLLGDFGSLNDQQLEAERALISGLKRVKGLSVQYSAESYSGENAADNIQVGQEMTLNGVYTWDLSHPVPHQGRVGYGHDPVMPAFLLEEPYDEEGPDGNNYNPNATQPVRRFQWWGWLTTIAGYISGNGYVWQFVDPVWQQHLNTQGALDMAHLNDFIRSIQWWKLVPSGLDDMRTLVVSPDNADTLTTHVAAAADREGSLLVAYIPPQHNQSVTIDVRGMNKLTHAYWFDPTSGEWQKIEDTSSMSDGVRAFHTPGRNSAGESDWVLVLTTEARSSLQLRR